MKYCPNCGSLGAANDLVCGHCGTRLTDQQETAYTPTEATIPSGPPLPEKGPKKKIWIFILAAVLVIGAVAALFLTHVICLKHDWQEATCTKPKTCRHCSKSEGEVPGHDWQEATCTAPQICSVCGEEKGEVKEHSWQDADCTAPKRCSVCAIEEGEAAGHDWQDATCTEPKTCAVCGETEGKASGHEVGEWEETEEATLIAGGREEQVCTVCDEVIDSRKTDAKKPEVGLTSFNFTDEEFIEWVNSEGAHVDEEELSSGRLGAGNTAYALELSKGMVLLTMNHGDNGADGNICAIIGTTESAEDIELAFSALSAFGAMIDPSFSVEDAVDAYLLGNPYVKAGMVIAKAENNIILTPIGYLAKVVLS